MKSLNMRSLWAVCCLVMSLVTAAGCGHEASSVVEDNGNDTIVIWTWDETFNVKAAKMAAEEYRKEHQNIEIIVEIKEKEESFSDIKNILSAKVYENLPDIIMIEDYDVQDMLSLYADEFVELTDRVDYDRFVDYKSQICSRNGHMYGIPFDSGTAALFYRVDILAQAGYTPEDMQELTWDEYMEIGRRVYERTGIPMLTLDPTDMPVVRLIMQSSGSWYVKQDGKTADIKDNEALVRALKIHEQLLKDEIGVSVNGWNEFISAFQKGEVATVLSGGWIVSNIKANEAQSGLWRVAPVPVAGENTAAASNVGGSGWYVLKHSPASEAAADFVVSMFGENDAFIDSLISEIGIVPAVKNPAVFSNYEAEDDFFGGQQVTKLLTQMAARIPVVNYGSKTYEIEKIIEAEFQNILTDGNLRECLERAQIRAEAIVRE